MSMSLPRAVTPGSTTNTVVLAIIRVLSSSSSAAEAGAGSDLPVSESGSVTHSGSWQSSFSHSRMSHCGQRTNQMLMFY